MWTLRIICCFAGLWLGLLSSAEAEPYRLTTGDTVMISHQGLPEPVISRLDIDGQVRLPDVGGLPLAGRTLDEAEALIDQALSARGLYVEPQSSLVMQNYAPVTVAGDVSSPGRFEYTPGMTVATALALSGGQQNIGVSRVDLQRAEAEAQGALSVLNLEIAAAVLRLARLEAEIAGVDAVLPRPELLAMIPARPGLTWEALRQTEAAILARQRSKTGELLAFWEREIAAIETQIALFEERITVQQGIVESTAGDLETSLDLQKRGLQTATRVSAVEQRDADARARLLELRSALIAGARAASDARRNRAQYLANREAEALASMQAARVSLEEFRLRYAKNLALLAVLQSGGTGTSLAADAMTLTYDLRSHRPGRPGGAALSVDTALLPGDVLIVRSAPAMAH